ncbi:MAG TPA: hypothetical protein VKV40_17625 [Ktedonobacteraceae bacterium]|nr:hypothetical protein [Ktedonobacteraceae bacterium]
MLNQLEQQTEAQMKAAPIPGLALAVVKDGQVMIDADGLVIDYPGLFARV